MNWVKYNEQMKIPVKSWCENIEEDALKQALNLASHPVIAGHVALMPDCHVGYGMPIGGVIACLGAVIPNAVGVDIGCGMVAVETGFPAEKLRDMALRRKIIDAIKQLIPVGEGNAHRQEQEWDGFEQYLDSVGGKSEIHWMDALDRRNLGTLGGGNHFIELQESDTGKIWLMIHSGSRNLGYKIAGHYNKVAIRLNEREHVELPSKDLAFLRADSDEGKGYIRDMQFALAYALENRRRMMASFRQAVGDCLGNIEFIREINIHHNYAALEKHFGGEFWIHRKGATSAKPGELGIIPGSMGASSYIVEGLGNVESFQSCSHGAGRRMGRQDACRRLSVEECDRAMSGIAFDRWGKLRSKWGKQKDAGLYDLGEAPQAYKDIDEVINSELDLIRPLVKLHPLAVVKG